MTVPFIVTILLNWNNARDTLACLEGLSACNVPNHRVVVVDNGSTDGSAEAIQAAHPALTILQTGANLGYTGGNNAGIRWALDQGADWVFLLNNDTTLGSDAISRLVAFGETDATIGILGPTIFHASQPAVIQSAGGLLDSHWRAFHQGENQPEQGQFPHPNRVDWISGCALMARAKMISQIGLLDERFFMYREELDWCIRAGHAGWRIWHVPEAHIWHAGVQMDYQPRPYVTYYMTRNQLLMLANNQAGLQVWGETIYSYLRTLLSWSLRTKWRHMHAHRDAMWRGIIDYLRQRWGPQSI